MDIHIRTQKTCRKRPVPPKDVCPLTTEEAGVSSSPGRSSVWSTTENKVSTAGFVLPSMLVLFLALLLILAVLLSALWKRKPIPIPVLAWLSATPALEHGHLSWAPWTLWGTQARHLCCDFQAESFTAWPHSPCLELLDELEDLEEPIMLLDPEPRPSGSMAYGTTRHQAARYGLPATWSTFAYSLQPSHSPFWALVEMVLAREHSATLGQLSKLLAQLEQADALQVLCKLG